MSHENLGRADAAIDLLSNDKDRLQKQVAAVTREFERRLATLEEDYAGEQNKVGAWNRFVFDRLPYLLSDRIRN